MKLSKLNMKKINLNDVDKDYSGQDILIKLGELYQYESGIYGYGNIWTKVERKIEQIIIEELDKTDCIQIDLPRLQPRNIWDRSGRWNQYTTEKDIMFQIKNNFGEYGLAPTAEECVTVFGSNRLLSYKQLPVIYYQINEKFRKEIRTRGYLFRPRTFTMMDAYSFDKNEEDMHKSFNKMHEVSLNIFKRLGINVISVVSDGGTMGGRVSEEFQAITKLGEDKILYDEKSNVGINKEVLDFEDKENFINKLNDIDLNSMKECNSVELGNNFELGTKYSESMNVYYQDENGENKPFYMGCYGIGLGRIIAILIENNLIVKERKVKGFVFPTNIAPYKLHIVYSENNEKVAFELYDYLLKNNIDVIIDDRKGITLGNRINDVSLLGTPKLLVLGNKFDGTNYEIENLKDNSKVIVTKEQILDILLK